MNLQPTDIRSLAIALLVPSLTSAQAQRRKSFDKAKLVELANSIKSSGMVNPILVRPAGEQFEIVAGERRFQAAQIAELEEVPVSVRELTDDQVLELQLIENLQREGLHELHEAEGYESLRKRGMTADEIAAKVGKSKEYVYGRIKLLALGKDARTAFLEGEINGSVALLIARIPVEKLQKEALKEITKGKWNGGPMSYRAAVEHVQQNYMLRLDQAPFDIANASLLPSAKACGACPKNTLAQPGLFGDVKAGADGICTDPVCHQSKVKAHAVLIVAKAKADGRKVIEGGAAKKALDYHGEAPAHDSGFVLPSKENYQDPKNRTWRQLAGKDAPTALIVHPESGKVIEVLARADVSAGMKKQGIKIERASSSGSSRTPVQTAAGKKAAAKEAGELLVRSEVMKQLCERAAKPFHRDELAALAEKIRDSVYPGPEFSQAAGDIEDLKTKAASEAQLTKFIRAHLFSEVIEGVHEKADLLFASAKRAGINVDAVRKALAAAAIAAEKKPVASAPPAKKSKKP